MPPLGTADLLEIHGLLARFGHAFDSGDAEGMARVLTTDAVVEGVVGPGYTIRGLAAAQAFTRDRRVDTPDHGTVAVLAFVDADGVVRARSRYIAPLVDGGVHSGDFFDILRRTPDGWRLAYRISGAAQADAGDQPAATRVLRPLAPAPRRRRGVPAIPGSSGTRRSHSVTTAWNDRAAAVRRIRGR